MGILQNHLSNRSEDTKKSSHQNLFKAIPDIVIITDRDGRILDASDIPYHLMIDDHLSTTYGKTVEDIFLPEISNKYIKALNIISENGQYQFFEFCIAQGDEAQTYEFRIFATFDNSMFCIIRDISNWKISAKSLKHYTSRLEILREIERAMLTAQTPTSIAQGVISRLPKLVPFDQAFIFQFDTEHRQAILLANDPNTGDECISQHNIQDIILDMFEQHIPSVFQGKVFVSNDIENEHSLNPIVSYLQKIGLASFIIIPLFTQKELVGIFYTASKTQDTYSYFHIEILQEVSDSLAIAIKQANLLETERKNRQEADTLRQATAIITSNLNLEQLLENILAQLERVIPYNFAYLILVINDRLKVVAERNREDTTSMIGYETSADNQIFTEMKTEKKAILLEDVKMDKRFVEWREEDRLVRSWLGVPLIRRGEVFGQLSLHSWQRGLYHESDIELAQAFANQASSAIENAELLELLEKRVADRTHELSALYNLASLSSEISELDQILQKSLKLSLDSISQMTGTIHLYDPQKKVFILAAQEKLPKIMLNNLQVIPYGSGLASWVFDQKQRVISGDIINDPRSIFYGTRKLRLQSCICSPLIVKNSFIGIMCVYSESLKYFSIDDLALLDTIADQVAIAVENAQLRKQAQSAAVMEERHRLARDLHDSVSQTLYSQALFADLGIKLCEMGKTEQLLKTLQDLKQSAYQTLKEMRLLLYELQPTVLEKMDIIEAIKFRLESVERRAGIEAKIIVDGPVFIPKVLETDIHHITIEALNNSLKHSGATQICIRFNFNPENLDLTIIDNGTGFNPEQISMGGYGLESMQQRAKQIGAKMTISTSPNSGTNIHLNVDIVRQV